jgi:hypothetical protein
LNRTVEPDLLPSLGPPADGGVGSTFEALANMDRQVDRAISSTLVHSVTKGEDAGQIADTIASVWQEIIDALCPIIGRGGVDALYRRSLHITCRTYPWLAGTQGRNQAVLDLALLRALLAGQGSAKAASGGGALLQAFYDLLAGVIGPSLTARLLRSAWANAVSHIATRGTSQ